MANIEAEIEGGKVFEFLLTAEGQAIIFRHLREEVKRLHLPWVREETPTDTGALRAGWRVRGGRTFTQLEVSRYARARRKPGSGATRKPAPPSVYVRWVDSFGGGGSRQNVSETLLEARQRYHVRAVRNAIELAIEEIQRRTGTPRR